MFDWFCSAACFLFKESAMLPLFNFPLGPTYFTAPQSEQAPWGAPAELNSWVEGDSAQAEIAALPWCRRQLNRCSWTSRCSAELSTSKPLNTLWVSLQQGVCSDQKRRNHKCDQDVFFLKEKQKEEGQKSDGLSSSLLECGVWSKLHTSCSHLGGLEVQDQ